MAHTKEQRKAYRQANKEKIKAYYQANREKINARCRTYRQANREKINAYLKKGAKDRGELWDRCFIPCIKHPHKRCNRSCYRGSGHRRCVICIHNRAAGQRYKNKESVKARRVEANRRRRSRPEVMEQSNARARSTALAKRIRENRI